MAVKNLNWSRANYGAPIIDITDGEIEVTNAFQNLGGIGNVKGVRSVFLWVKVDINSSVNLQVKALAGRESSAITTQMPIETISASKIDLDMEVREYPAEDGEWLFEVVLNGGVPFLKFQVKDSNNSDGQIEAAYVTFDVLQR